ncbi:hypothetical protein D9611_008329 [Ephemerocybe angulata]|uniref:Uncharacterized protein n=1 Tax=Ephemerocybe angulata TaxID=980116 RepID=A0A8H5BIP5_9AGAR|nr:hypothetical protein D9611_008329 [Tulosesus angulatus]
MPFGISQRRSLASLHSSDLSSSLAIRSSTMSTGDCTIPGNPDIAGIGVRVAIYIQTLLYFIPAFWALVDGKVTQGELDAAETQATTNLVLAFAILISSIVQAQTLGLTNYHASIVLNMSWMNNTNAFIYFLLYIQYKSQPGTPNPVPPTWRAWTRHIRDIAVSVIPCIKRRRRHDSTTPEVRQIDEGVNSGGVQDARIGSDDSSRMGAKILVKRFVLLLGSLHLSLMAGLGLWLWSNIRTFGKGQDAANECAATHALVTILGSQVPFSSEALRIASFVVYAIFLIPGVNLLLPVTLFLGFHSCCRLASPPETVPPDQIRRSSRWARRRFYIQNYIGHRWGMLPPFIGLIFLLAVNVVFIVDIELPLKRNAGLQGKDEAEWGFGQILAMLLLFMPLRDLFETILARRIRQRQKDLDLGLKSAIRSKDWDTICNLAGRGANPHVVLDGHGTAIQVACTSDRVDVIRALLDAGADPNLGDGQRDVNTIDRDNKDCLRLLNQFESHNLDGRSTLVQAAKHKYGVGVKLLLLRGVVPDTNHDEALGVCEVSGSRMTLAEAAANGQEIIVMILLAAPGIDVNAPDTALGFASRSGHEAALRLLLATPGINVNAPDTDGWTPLSVAARGSHEAVVKLLLAAPEIDVNAPDTSGRTPLRFAAEACHEAVVKLLLAVPGIDVNAPDTDGWTPLIAAAMFGKEAVVKLLLAVPGIDINARDTDGRTPLSFAARYGREAVVELLLAAPGINVNAPDFLGQTPLNRAAWGGHEAVVKVLLAAPGIAVNAPDTYGRTPLSFAAENSRGAVVKLLLAVPAIDVNAPDATGWTPLIIAARYGYEAVVKLLLTMPGIEVNAADTSGWTALTWAAFRGREAIVQDLCANPGIIVDVEDVKRRLENPPEGQNWKYPASKDTQDKCM